MRERQRVLPAQPKQDEGKTVRSAPFLGVVWLQQDDVDLLDCSVQAGGSVELVYSAVRCTVSVYTPD